MEDSLHIGVINEGALDGEQSAEQTREQAEKQQERYRAARAALAGARKDEKKTKKRELALAVLLSQFIKEAKGDERILNTCVEVLRQEIPAEFIVGMLSLLYPKLGDVLQEAVSDDTAVRKYQEHVSELTLMHAPRMVAGEVTDFHHEHLPDEVKQSVNTWIQVLLLSLSFHPEWILPRVLHHGKINSTIIQLATFIVEEFLHLYKIKGDFKRIRAFVFYVVSGVISKSETMMGKK